MSLRSVCVTALLATVFAASVAGADPGVVIAPATSPPEVDARTRASFQDKVKREVASDTTATKLDGYTLYPRLIQVRRYRENDAESLTVVCVVELVLTARDGRIVARTRGTASSAGATQEQVLEVATHGATTRLSAGLAANAGGPKRKVAGR